MTRARLEQSLRTARRELDSLEKALLDGTRHASRATDDYVHEIDRHRCQRGTAGGHADHAQVGTWARCQTLARLGSSCLLH